eukprot:12402658-Karenia_brevis.AAC.1
MTITIRAGKKKHEKDVFICKVCNALKSRCKDVITKRGLFSFGFEKLTTEKRVAFMRNNAHSYQNALCVAMQEVVQELTREVSCVAFEGTGQWLDDADLEKKYRDKPEQYQAIKENTRIFIDPIRKVPLYEDMAYTTKTSDMEYRETETRRQTMFQLPNCK